MFHIAAFGFSSTNTGAGVYVTLPAKTDGYLTPNSNNRFILPPPPPNAGGPFRIAAGHAGGTTMTLARIANATLRRIGFPSIVPINPGLTIPSLFPLASYGFNGPRLPIADEFGIEADAAAVEVQTGALWLHDGVMNGPTGEIFSLQFSATITTVANAWTLGTLAFTQPLPVGKYAVYGLDVVGTTCMYARLLFADGGPRPGVLGRASVSIFPQPTFRVGNFGKFGEFTSYAQPQLEIFASSAASITFTGTMDVQKVI